MLEKLCKYAVVFDLLLPFVGNKLALIGMILIGIFYECKKNNNHIQ